MGLTEMIDTMEIKFDGRKIFDGRLPLHGKKFLLHTPEPNFEISQYSKLQGKHWKPQEELRREERLQQQERLAVVAVALDLGPDPCLKAP